MYEQSYFVRTNKETTLCIWAGTCISRNFPHEISILLLNYEIHTITCKQYKHIEIHEFKGKQAIALLAYEHSPTKHEGIYMPKSMTQSDH